MTLTPEFLTADQVAWDMKGPCNDCPFRRDAPDHEGVCASVKGYIEALEENRFSHSCHKTDNRADGPRNHTGAVQHCGGALHFIVRAKCDLQLPLLQAADAGKINLRELSTRARRDKRVFASVSELLSYYIAMARRILEKKAADPTVCVVSAVSPWDLPLSMPLSVARSAGLEVLQCCKCGKPATTHDRFWPCYTDRNFCDDCPGDNFLTALEQLAADPARRQAVSR